MPTSYTLTEAELGLLQKLLDDSRRRTVNSQSRYQQGQQIRFSPDVYVALVPDSGIPGLLATYPGKATCDIYYLTDLSSDERLVPYETTKVVFNLSHNPVPGCSWILVIRDKAGRWWASGNYFETVTECDTGTGTGTGTGTEANVSDKIWARITDRQDYAHSWVEAEQIATTAGVFPTIPGTSFKDKSGGLSGTYNLYERNQYSNIPVGAYVEIWQNGDDWLCDFELDHFTGYILSGTGPDYLVAEEVADNPRVVTAYEFNGVLDIAVNTRVQVWVYLIGGQWKYEFTYQKPQSSSITIVDIDVTNISNATENITYNYFSTTTNLITKYEYVCIDGYYCGWMNLCDCTWVPWYCYNDTCRQFIEPPPGASGPYDTKPECEAVAPCTSTGTSSLPTGTGVDTGTDNTAYCTEGTILVSCSTNLLPRCLYLCVTGCCTSLGSIPIDFTAPSNWVSASVDCNGHSLSFNIYCQGGRWFIVIVCDNVGNSIRRMGTMLSSNPVEISFDITNATKLSDCCDENITVTVTETEVDCNAVSGTDCTACDAAVDGIGATLDVTITNKTGDCTCLPDSFQMTETSPNFWEGTYSSPGCEVGYETCGLQLECIADVWSVDTASCAVSATLVSAQCNPLMLVFDVTNPASLPFTQVCDGSYRITITEAP